MWQGGCTPANQNRDKFSVYGWGSKVTKLHEERKAKSDCFQTLRGPVRLMKGAS